MGLEKHHLTADKDRLPVTQKVGYGVGAIVTIVAVNSLMQLTGLVYIDGLGVSAIWMGFAMAIPRLWDCITDPIVGTMSDNCRSRFGRRIPYIFVGAFLVGFTFALLFTVPVDWSKKAVFTYFLLMSLLFYTAVTIYSVPHGALGFEMTDDYHERTRVFGYASFIGNIGAVASPWLYYFANRSVFNDEVEGMKWVCLGMGLILFISGSVCALTCKETKKNQTQKQDKIKLWESFKITCKNGTFVRLVVAFVLVIIGFQFVMGFGNFVMIHYVFFGDKAAASTVMGVNGTVWAVTGILGVFPMAWLSLRIGKTKTVMCAFFIIVVGNLLKIVCYNRVYPWLSLIPTILLSMGMVMCFTLVNAMNADICDEDELRTGQRREGSYYAVYGWWWKMSVSIASIVSGYLLKMTGYIEGGDTQPDSALFWLRFWEIMLPSVLCLVSILILSKYPLTENRAYEVKELLNQQKESDEVIS